MVSEYYIKKALRLRWILVLSLVASFLLLLILSIILEMYNQPMSIVSLLVIIDFVLIAIISLIWNKYMSLCSCPCCKTGRFLRSDLYFNSLFIAYKKGKSSFICPVCQNHISIDSFNQSTEDASM